MKILLVGNLPEDRQESMRRFTEALRDGFLARGHDVTVVTPSLRLARLGPAYRYNGVPKYLGYFDKFALFPRTLRRLVAELRPDVVHLTDHAGAVYRPAFNGTPLLATCHDLFEVRAACGEPGRSTVGRGGKLYQAWIHKSLCKMPHLACVSRSTHADALRLTGLAESQLSVIPNALNHPYKRIPVEAARAELAGLDPALLDPACGGFLLWVGGEQWYKNREGLLKIYAALRRRLSPAPRLVMVGPPLSADLAALAGTLNLHEHIVPLAGISAAKLEALYNLAEGLLFPSLEEGFGWPVAEAQACGCPVFTTNRAPMTDVGGAHAVYFDPRDAEGAARIIADSWAGRHLLVEPAFESSARWRPGLMLDAYEALYRRLSTP
jgi:glycosyltransferase involved in cell wall biosynthesis